MYTIITRLDNDMANIILKILLLVLSLSDQLQPVIRHHPQTNGTEVVIS